MKTLQILTMLCFTLPLALSPVSNAYSEPYEGPMRFSVESCDGSICEESVYAEGLIEDNTAAKLKDFIEKEKIQFRLIAFNSIGGSLFGGIQLGRLIRSLHMNASIYDQSVCFSSCAYAFLGGISRTMADHASLGFHQFKSQNVKFVDEGRTQLVQAQIGVYVREMGVTSAIVDFASTVAPQKMGIINREDAGKIGLLTDYKQKEKWTSQVSETGDFELTITESPDQDRRIKITLRMRQKVLEMAVLYTYTGSRRSVTELKDAFENQEDLELSGPFSQKSPSESYELKGPWKPFGTSGKSYLFTSPIPRKVVKFLSQLSSFNLFAGYSMPNVYRDLRPFAEFRVDGLSQGLDAITKAYGGAGQGYKEDLEDAVQGLKIIHVESQEQTKFCNAIIATPEIKHPNTEQCRMILAKPFNEREGLFYVTTIPGLELRASDEPMITIPFFYGPYSSETDALAQKQHVLDEVRKIFGRFQEAISAE